MAQDTSGGAGKRRPVDEIDWGAVNEANKAGGVIGRIHKIATGFGGALQAPLGLAKDLATAPWRDDDDFDGFVHTIVGRTKERFGQVFGNVLGPEEGLGAVFGGLPESVRGPSRSVIDPALRGVETAYREGVGEPLSTALTVSSLVDAPGGGGFAGFFDTGNWKAGYRIAQHRSPGQAIALAILTKDITNDAEVARVAATDAFEFVSGLSDAVLRFTLDPSAVAGGLAKGFRAGYRYPIQTIDDIDVATTGKTFDRMLDDIETSTPADFRHRWFPDHEAGAQITTILKDAGETVPLVADASVVVMYHGTTTEAGSAIRQGGFVGDVYLTPDRTKAEEYAEARTAQARQFDGLPDARPHVEEVRLPRQLLEDYHAQALENDIDLGNVRLVPASEVNAQRLPNPEPSITVREARTRAVRAMMGDPDAQLALYEEHAAVAAKIERAVNERDMYASINESVLVIPETVDLSTHVGRVKAELDELYPQRERLERREAAYGTIGELPRERRLSSVSRSDFAQAGPFAPILRTVFNKNYHSLVDLERPNGDIQASRFLREAGVPDALHDELRGRYMAALNAGERQTALVAIEEAAVGHIAAQAGMTVDDIEAVLKAAGTERGGAVAALKGKVYDGEGRSRLTFTDDEGRVTDLPLLVTQEANVLPLVDLNEIKRATTRIGQFRLRHPTTNIPPEMATSFTRLWKTSVLIRPGWPIRVVGDEQLRIIAKIGALSQLKALRSGIRNYWDDVAEDTPKAQQVPGLRDFTVGDYEVESAFGIPGDSVNAYKHLASSRASFEKFAGKGEKGILGRFKGTGEHRSLSPLDDGYGAAWENDVNMQIGKDRMARQFLEGRTVDEVTDWLTGTAEGQAYMRRLPYRASNPRNWAGTVSEQVASYTAEHPELAELALAGKATFDDLQRLFPDPSSRPLVHGEVLAQTLGNSTATRLLSGIVEGAYRLFGSLPSDTLSRQPFFDAMYQAEVKRLVGLVEGADVVMPQRMLTQIERKSREYALGQTKDLLYDLAETSRLAEMLKFFMPFYSAWEEVITRWAGLAIENPRFVARARLVWSAPDKAGLVQTDDQGTEWIVLKLPEWADDLPGMRGLSTQGAVKLPKEGFNMALQGMPGFSPLVQVPVNELVKDRPDLESAVKHILPFGSTQDTFSLLLPAAGKRALALGQGEENSAYRNALLRIYYDKVTDFETGKRKNKPTYAEAKREADSFFKLRIVANLVSPVSPSFVSPYQLYIDAHRALMKEDPTTADQRFLDRFGPEYFALTQSVTRSMDGVFPTLEAWKARAKYKDLIEADPELGGLIIGKEGAGVFHRGVYNAQLATSLRPGSQFNQREPVPFEDAVKRPHIDLGWMEYGKAMDLIDAERIQRGLPNLQVKAASDLAEIRRQIVANLVKKYPEWDAERAKTDANKFRNRIKAMEAIVQDPRLARRPDIVGLAAYLDARRAIVGELGARKKAGGSSTLRATGNTDLALLWSSLTSAIVERHVAFGDTYHRYLEHDPMSYDRTLDEAA